MNTRPAITTSSIRYAVVVAFAHAASMGACALATFGLQSPMSANGGRPHPGMEDV